MLILRIPDMGIRYEDVQVGEHLKNDFIIARKSVLINRLDIDWEADQATRGTNFLAWWHKVIGILYHKVTITNMSMHGITEAPFVE